MSKDEFRRQGLGALFDHRLAALGQEPLNLLGSINPSRGTSVGLAALGDLFTTRTLLGVESAMTERYRRRREWNDRFSHWEKAESDSESGRIERARAMVKDALSSNQWLRDERVKLVEQGSFTNRTNVRGEADIDLRVHHPGIKVINEHDFEFLAHEYKSLGYSYTSRSFNDINQQMRTEIGQELVRKFGPAAVDLSCNKAIRVKGLEGSRGEVDVVPAFELHLVGSAGISYGVKAQGAAILSLSGGWTYNYPDLHIDNGRAKRRRTGLQFKRIVRIVKRMRADMQERGIFTKKVPSFLIECLVYLVEDDYFTFDGDDRYGRVKRVLERALWIVLNGKGVIPINPLYEINGVKALFESGQAWTKADAIAFLSVAIAHLGDA